jgi:hypothetical protein
MRILIENKYPNPAYNHVFEHTYVDRDYPDSNPHNHIDDFAFAIECLRDYEQIQLNRLTKESLSQIQRDVVRAKLTKLDKLKNTYSSLVEFVIDTSLDTL